MAPQSCIRDTAGAGDWLTAGMISNLLQEPGVPSTEDMLESIEYGQRLSAISLAYDGPGGALTVLGAPIIRQIAGDSSPIQLGSPLEMPAQVHRNPTPDAAQYCELCLTETSAISR